MNTLAGRIRLDFRSEDPLYLQIVRQVEALVAEGVLQPGDQLPTVREMAIDLRINFSTVARAYRILDEQRLISTQRGRGTYIWENTTHGEVQDAADRQESDRQESGRQMAENMVSYESLSGLAQRFFHDAAELGATTAQIEQVFQQQLEGWKRDHPDHSVNNFRKGY